MACSDPNASSAVADLGVESALRIMMCGGLHLGNNLSESGVAGTSVTSGGGRAMDDFWLGVEMMGLVCNRGELSTDSAFSSLTAFSVC